VSGLVDSQGKPILKGEPLIGIILEGRKLNFGANQALIRQLPLETRRRIVEAVTKLLFGVVSIFILTLSGCAGQQLARPSTPQQKFWRDCQEVIPAKADGFQHFLCQDVKGRRWEVLIRREGK
jgi:hypothetical protein